MSMRGFIGSAVVATFMLAGCGTGQVDEGDGTTEQNLGKFRCPDPTTDCTVGNGAGVYTEEDGYAGMGAEHYMITHFINQSGGGVTLQARYFNSATGLWDYTTGQVYYANYAGLKNLTVLSVKETNTAPSFALFDPGTSTYYTASEDKLLSLQIVISLGKLYTLDWDNFTTETMKTTIQKYNMRWRLTGSSTATQYCLRADSSKDQVVFQGGMSVNPTTAAVTRNSTTDAFVTLSCRYGGIATVRLWGYPYRAPYNTYFFDAGLQMKRASYCADSSFYTHANTKIRIWDSAGENQDPMTAAEVEAWWTPNGATCIGPLRHSGMGFSGKCNGVPLPPCSTVSGGKLADAASPPAF